MSTNKIKNKDNINKNKPKKLTSKKIKKTKIKYRKKSQKMISPLITKMRKENKTLKIKPT